jgi:hypothetical protein
MLNLIMLSVIMPNVIMLRVVLPNVIMFSITWPFILMLMSLIFSVELHHNLQLRDRERLWDRLRHLLLVHPATQLHRDHQAPVGQQAARP